MCMKGTTEGCVLLERMTKVETKQNFILLTVIAMFAVIVVIAFKLLNTQIYLLTGGEGLRTVSEATHEDVQAVKKASEDGGK